MSNYSWSGLGLANDTTITTGNVNTSGNGDAVALGSAGTTPTIKTVRPGGTAGAAGFKFAGATSGDVARLDTTHTAAEAAAVQFIYTPTATPTSADNALIASRNANATPAFNGYLYHQATTATIGALVARAASGGNLSSAMTPALVTNDSYQVDYCVLRNTLTTPSTSNGRIMFRVRSLSAPGTWNSGAEFYYDSGYTVNTTVDTQSTFRVGKTTTTSLQADATVTALQWRDLAAPETSTTKSLAIANFVQPTGPTVNTTPSGAHYLLSAVATPVVGGAITYGITQTAGTTKASTVVAPGVWFVDQDTAGTTTYQITATEAGGGVTTNNIVVPQVAASTTGQFRRRKMVSGSLT